MTEHQKREKYAQFKHFECADLKILLKQIGEALKLPLSIFPVYIYWEFSI